MNAPPTSTLATPVPHPRHAPATPSTQLQSPEQGHCRRSSGRSLCEDAQGQNESAGAEGAELVTASGWGREMEAEVEVIAWRLSMLKRFNVEKETLTGNPRVFLLDCGP